MCLELDGEKLRQLTAKAAAEGQRLSPFLRDLAACGEIIHDRNPSLATFAGMLGVHATRGVIAAELVEFSDERGLQLTEDDAQVFVKRVLERCWPVEVQSE